MKARGLAFAALAVGLSAAMGVQPARGQEPPPPPGPVPRAADSGEFGEEGMPKEVMIGHLLNDPKVIEELGLTTEKADKLRQDLHDIRIKIIDLRAELEKAALEQVRLMTERDLKEDALMVAIEKTGRIRTELAKIRIRPLILVRQNLNWEQIGKAKELLRGLAPGRGPNVEKHRPMEGRSFRERLQRPGRDEGPIGPPPGAGAAPERPRP
jgi:hypothetical protein